MSEQMMALASLNNVQTSPLGMYHTIRIDDALEDMQDWIPALQTIDSSQAGDVIHMKYNCRGGRDDIMNAFLAAFDQTQAKIISEVVGNASSAASILFLRGDEFIVNKYAEYMVHRESYGTSGSGQHLKQRVDFTSEQSIKMMKQEYKHFLTEEEITSVIEGAEIYLNSDEIMERLNLRQELLAKEAGEFEPDPEVMKSWSKERLLSFMFDEEYDNDYWESVDEVLGESLAKEDTCDSKDLYYAIKELTDTCSGGDFSDEVPYVTFGELSGHYITSEHFLCTDTDEVILHEATWYNETPSAKNLKLIATNLGIPFNKNASQKVMVKLVLEFVQKVVDILNS